MTTFPGVAQNSDAISSAVPETNRAAVPGTSRTTGPGTSRAAAVPGPRNLVQINTMCEDLMSVLEEKLRDINAGTREDDIWNRFTNPSKTTTANQPKETSLSGKL